VAGTQNPAVTQTSPMILAYVLTLLPERVFQVVEGEEGRRRETVFTTYLDL
jgi:hypothetical protein